MELISVIVPCYNEEQAIPLFFEEMRKTAEQMGDWAAHMGIEAVFIDKNTTIRQFRNELRWNEAAYGK